MSAKEKCHSILNLRGLVTTKLSFLSQTISKWVGTSVFLDILVLLNGIQWFYNELISACRYKFECFNAIYPWGIKNESIAIIFFEDSGLDGLDIIKSNKTIQIWPELKKRVEFVISDIVW